MGRRSINTTKSGKYMNPTDQARKEARKRELRKNKKQRMLVRAAVLKGKDPFQIIADMERLDQMEYNVNTPPPLNEKVLKDKRRKMKETWDRLCRLYMKEDHDRFLELKRIEVEYEGKRNQMIKFFESVKSAQEVAIDDIPLPTVPMEQNNNNASNPPMIMNEPIVPQSILKKHNFGQSLSHKTPPGVPPGPPPVLSDNDDDSDDEYISEDKDKNKKLRFSDEPPAADKESDINEFLKEIEQVEKAANVKDSLPQTVHSIQSLNQSSSGSHSHTAIPPPPSLRGTNIPPAPPSLVMFRPQLSSGVSSAPVIRGATQASNIQGLIMPRPTMPSGFSGPPPPLRAGLPPHRLPAPPSAPRMIQQAIRMQAHPHSSFAAPPAMAKRDDKKTHYITDKATIEAKPQLRNLSADATRFTPVALRVKREEKIVKKPNSKLGYETEFNRYSNTSQNASLNAPSKDDAYQQFMKEMENFL